MKVNVFTHLFMFFGYLLELCAERNGVIFVLNFGGFWVLKISISKHLIFGTWLFIIASKGGFWVT